MGKGRSRAIRYAPNAELLVTSPPLATAVAQAAQTLRDGGVVLYPTETFYAVGAALHAVDRAEACKGRPGSSRIPAARRVGRPKSFALISTAR